MSWHSDNPIFDVNGETEGLILMNEYQGKLAPIVWEWLENNRDGDFDLGSWDVDYDHDGHNADGWRVYTGSWGKIGGGFLAILPVKLWFGK